VRHHAVEGREVLCHHAPVAGLGAAPHQRSLPLDEQRCRPQHFSAPDPFALDLRIVREGGAARFARRQAEIDGVAELLAGETEAQADHFLARRALHRLLAATDRARKGFRPGPER